MLAVEMYVPAWRSVAMHESSPAVRGASVKFRKECKDYTPSQFYKQGIAPEGADAVHQDLEAQTFEDASFDLVITQDVMEHVFHPDLAFREIARTLRPGGWHIFTTPLVRKMAPTERRAELRDGSIHHLQPPSYHDNPVDEEGSLVTFDWGYDISEAVFEASGMFSTILNFRDRSLGLDGDLLEVIVSRKRS